MKELLIFLKNTKTVYNGYETVYPENSLYNQILEELDWRNKSDEEIIQIRLSDANLYRRWGADDLITGAKEEGWSIEQLSMRIDNLEDIYSGYLAEVHKSILILLDYLDSKIDSEVPYISQDISLLRLNVILLVEKKNIVDYYTPKAHLSKSFLSEVLKDIKRDISDKDLITKLELFEYQYEVMYDNWEGSSK